MEAIARASILFPSHHLLPKSSPSLILHRIPNSTFPFPLKFPLYSSTTPLIKPTFELKSSLEGVALEELPNEIEDKNGEKKLYVVNLPWTLTSDELKNLFSECGTVKDVELIRDNKGRNRGFGFVTMGSGDEAQAVIDKFHSKELSGRTIKVEYARRLKKPRPQSETPVVAVKETRHKLYVSNLQWKVRSTHLREFFSSNFSPVSARVVFESSPSGRSAGYGFVSFNTREEAEAAISTLDGQELLGRPVRLKLSERNSEGEVLNEGDEKEREKDNFEESTDMVDYKQVSEEIAES